MKEAREDSQHKLAFRSEDNNKMVCPSSLAMLGLLHRQPAYWFAERRRHGSNLFLSHICPSHVKASSIIVTIRLNKAVKSSPKHNISLQNWHWQVVALKALIWKSERTQSEQDVVGERQYICSVSVLYYFLFYTLYVIYTNGQKKGYKIVYHII